MPTLPLELLKAGAEEIGIALTEAQLAQCDSYAEMMLRANDEFNLTRIVDPLEIVRLHYLDSWLCLAACPESMQSFIDIGTGCGFPGIALAIVRPECRAVLVDSTAKKSEFVKRAVAEVGLKHTKVVCARAEELGKDKTFREKFDVAFARALGDMNVVAELCLAFVRVGGVLVAQKTLGSEAEARAAWSRIDSMGGETKNALSLLIPGTDVGRQLVIVRKARPTPPRYPRAYTKIASEESKRRESRRNLLTAEMPDNIVGSET
jgi:16S rRNA (guanine527-N7)-methyltransferase